MHAVVQHMYATPFEECWDLCYSSALKFNDLATECTYYNYNYTQNKYVQS